MTATDRKAPTMAPQPAHDLHSLASAAVVVGVDGSAASTRAVEWAARTASARGRRLVIAHGYDFQATSAMLTAYDVVVPPIAENVRRNGEQVLASADRVAADIDPDLDIVTELSESKPARLLIELSQEAHLTVLGAGTNVGTLAHLGSTLLAVASHGRGRVVVVREAHPQHGVRDSGPVVVGVDGSSVGEPAIEAAFSEASERGTGLVAIHAWSDLSLGVFAGASYLDLPTSDLETGERALLAERLAGWQEKYPNVDVGREVHLSDPRSHLMEWSKSAQLVVVGSRGRGGFRGLLLGSTSNYLVQHAHCPVMVVHPD
ncbi:universal stress protein [Nocardia cyriacigeorgica]|uniref:universal stress protein n=1 Tax=Nocardia cyriacigeorgica TaxID=135487 RepID=UPI001E36390C|nr:universal stress protein [Nocardia cyriacigeorgica]